MNQETLVYILIGIIVLHTIGDIYLEKQRRKLREISDKVEANVLELIKNKNETLDTISRKYREAIERENFLLKTMNDGMKVKNTKEFLAHRMSMAPSDWEPKTKEEIGSDNI